MKSIIIFIVLLSIELSADRIIKTSAMCASADTIAELAEYAQTNNLQSGSVEMELWLMKHECKVIDNKTEIEVLDYTGKTKEIVKIMLKKTGEVVYGLSKNIQIEQPGQKNIIYKF